MRLIHNSVVMLLLLFFLFTHWPLHFYIYILFKIPGFFYVISLGGTLEGFLY